MNFASSKGYEKQTGPLGAVGLQAAGSQALGPSLINSAIAITSEDELMYEFFGIGVLMRWHQIQVNSGWFIGDLSLVLHTALKLPK
jgi:hypothetical protein